MKLVFINDGVYKYASGAPSATGGAERQQWLLARALAAARWQVAVGVTDEIATERRCNIDGVDFIGIGHGYGHVFSAWYRFFVSERPDWCYWRGADYVLGPAVEIAKLADVRTIFSTAFDTDVYPVRALSRRSSWWPLYAWGLSRCDKILLQHSSQLANLPSRYLPKAKIVPSIASVISPTKSHFDRPSYVAWVGTLRQPKRPDLLVEIARKAPDLRFVVCGAPSLHRSPVGFGERVIHNLQQLPNINFLGQVPPEKAQEIITNAALLLSTSDGEGFPNTFLQAWAAGTPVVSIRIDPNRVIEQLGLGAVCGTMENAIAEMRTLMCTPSGREEIAVRAREYVAAHHAESSVMAAFESAVGKLCDANGCAAVCQPSSPLS